ncbi:unnamed protein product [Effrenium voratum]|uniref:C3H1-type domain-containing protein n=1 Tax=Effrenium voratum TaxID=2562239 RepID=A0AA36IZD3_9DINO|nr:unnamed protein product [Effrenium voratum]
MSQVDVVLLQFALGAFALFLRYFSRPFVACCRRCGSCLYSCLCCLCMSRAKDADEIQPAPGLGTWLSTHAAVRWYWFHLAMQFGFLTREFMVISALQPGRWRWEVLVSYCSICATYLVVFFEVSHFSSVRNQNLVTKPGSSGCRAAPQSGSKQPDVSESTLGEAEMELEEEEEEEEEDAWVPLRPGRPPPAPLRRRKQAAHVPRAGAGLGLDEEIYRPEKDSDAAKYVEDLVRRTSNLDFLRHQAAGLSAGSLISHPEKEADHVENLENDHVKDLENLDFVRHEAAGPSAGSLISHPEKEADHVENLENDHVKDLENLDFVRHEAARLSAGSVGHPELCHKPCLFLFKVGGCPLGAECNFCHEPHERAKVDRRMRQLLHDLDEAQQLAIVLPHLRERGQRLQMREADRLLTHLEQLLASLPMSHRPVPPFWQLSQLRQTLHRLNFSHLLQLCPCDFDTGPILDILRARAPVRPIA